MLIVAEPQSFTVDPNSISNDQLWWFPRTWYQLTCTKIGESVKLRVTLGTCVWRIHGNDQTICAQCFRSVTTKHVALNQNLIVRSRMDCLKVEVFVQVVENMLVTKSACRATSAFVIPVIMMVCYMQVSLVYFAKNIAISNKRGLPYCETG